MTHTELIRWEPFVRDTLAGRFNQLFGRTWEEAAGETLPSWYPPVDIYDTGDALVLEAELPGFKLEDFDIRVENNILYISGERRRPMEGDGHGPDFIRTERPMGIFTRSFSLPATVDDSKIEATYRDGILKVTLPKDEKARPRRIDVRVH